MSGKKHLAIASLLWLVIINQAKAAENSQIDNKLAVMLNKLSPLKDGCHPDQLNAANGALAKYLCQVCLDRQLQSAPLRKAQDAGLSVVSSTDGKLRYYSWDTLTGGTMHFFDAVVVYDGGSEKMNVELRTDDNNNKNEAASSYDQLDTIKTIEGKTVYLVQGLDIGATILHSRTIQALVIDQGKLKKFPFFRTPKKLLDNISYCFADYGNDTDIKFSKDKQTLSIPLLKADPKNPDINIATGRFLTYRFDGSHYVFKAH